MKIVNRAIDPFDVVPVLPPTLPMGLDDDGDAVAEHDMLETAYMQYRERSTLTRWRMDLKNGGDPLEPSTERQVLAGLIVAAVLAVWRMDAAKSAR